MLEVTTAHGETRAVIVEGTEDDFLSLFLQGNVGDWIEVTANTDVTHAWVPVSSVVRIVQRPG
jgi:hypothetical protein